jgi:hypothetical protein
MVTLESLKQRLEYAPTEIQSSHQPAQMSPLSDAQYSTGFDALAGQMAYRDLIIPQLSSLLEFLLETRTSVSVLEIGPGPKSILGRLPGHLQRRIGEYSAFEPNELFASRLEESLRRPGSEGSGTLPCRAGLSINCSWSHVVVVDMSAFGGIHVLPAESEDGAATTSKPLVVVGAGCTSGEIIGTTFKSGLTVPLGSRPSVGAGLWLQGGIGHLSRLRGLGSDAVVGAVILSVADSHVMHIGCVPAQHRPTGSVRPDNDDEML